MSQNSSGERLSLTLNDIWSELWSPPYSRAFIAIFFMYNWIVERIDWIVFTSALCCNSTIRINKLYADVYIHLGNQAKLLEFVIQKFICFSFCSDILRLYCVNMKVWSVCIRKKLLVLNEEHAWHLPLKNFVLFVLVFTRLGKSRYYIEQKDILI